MVEVEEVVEVVVEVEVVEELRSWKPEMPDQWP